MSKIRLMAIVASLAWIVACPRGEGSEQPTAVHERSYAELRRELARAVQDAVIVGTEGDGVERALRLAMERLSAQDPTAPLRTADLDAIALAILSGCDPASGIEEYLASTTAAVYAQGDPANSEITSSLRGLVLRVMVDAAFNAGDASEVKRAAGYARAALVLVANDPTLGDEEKLSGLMRDDRLCKIAKLTGEPLEKLRATCRALLPDAKSILSKHKEMLSAAAPLDRLIESEGALDAKVLEEFTDEALRQLDRSPRLRDRWYLTHMVWQAYCLARARGDDRSQRSLQERFDAAAERARDPHAARWLREATRLDGPPPPFAAIQSKSPFERGR